MPDARRSLMPELEMYSPITIFWILFHYPARTVSFIQMFTERWSLAGKRERVQPHSFLLRYR